MADVEITWNGATTSDTVRDATSRGLLMAAEFVLGESLLIVPLEEATLARSGVTSVDIEKQTAAVSYDTPYAVRQHEELTYRHDPGRSAKYLEKPAVETRRQQSQIIANEIRGRLK